MEKNPQNVVFRALDALPGQLWYLLGMGSILTSLILQLSGKKDWADFVGKWPPTFFAVGLYHKLVRPGDENAAGALENAASKAQHAVETVAR